MKPFNLEEAKKGAEVITRDGSKVRIICFDRKHKEYNIIGLIYLQEDDDFYEDHGSFMLDGRYLEDGESDYDLFMAPIKKTGWVNVYSDNHMNSGVSLGNAYRTKEEAEKFDTTNIRIDCIKIEWEE